MLVRVSIIFESVNYVTVLACRRDNYVDPVPLGNHGISCVITAIVCIYIVTASNICL